MSLLFLLILICVKECTSDIGYDEYKDEYVDEDPDYPSMYLYSINGHPQKKLKDQQHMDSIERGINQQTARNLNRLQRNGHGIQLQNSNGMEGKINKDSRLSYITSMDRRSKDHVRKSTQTHGATGANKIEKFHERHIAKRQGKPFVDEFIQYLNNHQGMIFI